MIISEYERRLREEKRKSRKREYWVLYKRLIKDHPNENPRRLIAERLNVSYWLVCDVLVGRR